MPSTRTTLLPAALTCGSRAIFESGGGTSAAGPRIDGNGSKRASAWMIGPEGGSVAFSSFRIAERWIGSRSSRAPGVWSATAPAIHTKNSPMQATSALPPTPSTSPSRSPSRRLSWNPSASSPVASRPPRSRAPMSADRGAYGDSEPSSRTSGPSRDPMNAPAANPASASPPAISPWPNPQMAMRPTNATMIQSRPVKREAG